VQAVGEVGIAWVWSEITPTGDPRWTEIIAA
jgi:hypothetical protein